MDAFYILVGKAVVSFWVLLLALVLVIWVSDQIRGRDD